MQVIHTQPHIFIAHHENFISLQHGKYSLWDHGIFSSWIMTNLVYGSLQFIGTMVIFVFAPIQNLTYHGKIIFVPWQYYLLFLEHSIFY